MAKKTRNARIINKIVTTPGAIATIPPSNDHTDGTWIETDIYEGEYLFNTYDKRAFSRMGGIIVDVTFNIVPNFTIENSNPQTIDEQSSGNVVTVTGTNFKDNMTVRIPDTNGLVFSNVSVTYLNSTSLQVNFDVAGDIINDATFAIYLNKEGYETSFQMYTDVDIIITGDNSSGLVGRKTSENLVLYTNDSNASIASVVSNNPNVIVLSNDASTDGSGNLNVSLNPNAAAGDEAFTLTITGDEAEVSNAYALATEPALYILSSSSDTAGVNNNQSNFLVTFSFSKAVDGISNAVSDNVNIVVNSYNLADSTYIDVYLNTTAASFGESFNIAITCDGETTANYAMSIEPALVIDSFSPNPHIFETDSISINLNKPAVEVSTDTFRAVHADGLIVPNSSLSSNTWVLNLDNKYLDSGQDLPIAVQSTTEISPTNTLTLGYNSFVYDEVTEDISTVIDIDSTKIYDITGWNKIAVPILFLHTENVITNRIYAYESKADRTTGTSVAVFYVEEASNTVIELNSSGYGGQLGTPPLSNMNRDYLLYADRCRVVAFNEVGNFEDKNIASLSNNEYHLGKLIQGWDETVVPYLYFERTTSPDRWYAYESKADRTTGTSVAVFYIESGSQSVIELNSSGYGGYHYSLYNGSVGDQYKLRKGQYNYAVTNEVGTSGDYIKTIHGIEPHNGLLNDGNPNANAWDRESTPVLYCYCDVSGSDVIEVYDNATSRNNRTSLDMLCSIDLGYNFGLVTQANGSGWNGQITIWAAGLTDGDKFYITAS